MLENIQYARNVGSMFRTADAAGVKELIMTGISHHPPFGKDLEKVSRSKERSVKWQYFESTANAIRYVKKLGFEIVAVEITDQGIDYRDFQFPQKLCLLVGNEAYGVVNKTLETVDSSIYIPMQGKGASLNVSTAAAIALFKAIE